MNQKYLTKIKFFTLCTSLLLVLAFFSGCTQNFATGDNAPITVTVHSATKVAEYNGVPARAGSYFVITNLTLENHGMGPYTFNEKAATISGGTIVEEKLYTRLTECRYWGKIPPGEKRTGILVFGVKNDTQDFTLTFFYNNGQDIVTKELGSIPLESGSAAASQSTDSNIPTTMNAGDTASQGPVSLTINSISKASRVNDYGIGNGTMAMQGHVFVILDVTVKNNELQEGFIFTDKSTTLKNLEDNYNVGLSLNGLPEVKEDLKNAIIPPITIAQNQALTGKIIFGTTDSDSYAMNLVGPNKTILAKKHIRFTGDVGKVTANTESESGMGNSGLSPTTKSDSGINSALLTSENFTYVVENLDTPVKATQYAQEKFTFVYHDGWVSYSPEIFFKGLKGDCKDYATFLSYVLAKHGYDAKIVSFIYYDHTSRNGHVVTLFTDTDGKMKYVTTPDVTKFREVTSVEDLLAKECVRLGVPSIAKYQVHPAGTLDVTIV